MTRRSLVSSLLPGVLLAASCGGEDPSSPAGASISVMVDGQAHRFQNARADLQSFIGDAWLLTVTAGPELDTNLSFAFFTHATTAGELSGSSLENDYREHNPDRYPMEDILNFVRAGGQEYLGYRVEGTVRSVSDAEITLDVRGTFLEFPLDWEDSETVPTGREVELSASITVPIAVETQ